ncbi:msr5462 [Mesorhizobium japonicum MAFF 303099]|uniref:Msr5462 protein n=1 Tax=Mesorhizobium japonicum (strain LMG 29417 / CECT 9101 / MAFF 303099) TaxID=266835 RepID=Q98BR2_RHILO|nr:msr5462 [Mesorhizobium japonicum MAFF 303099]
MIAMDEDVVFCAKTGRRILDDNVIQLFPLFNAKPVPEDDAQAADALTVQPTLADDRPPEPGDDI